MLVLSRKPGQCVRIGDEIEVTVLEVQGDRVRLGFKAPPDVAVHRQEVYLRIEKEKETEMDARQQKLFAGV